MSGVLSETQLSRENNLIIFIGLDSPKFIKVSFSSRTIQFFLMSLNHNVFEFISSRDEDKLLI